MEESIKPANIKIIQNPRESINLAYDIVKSAKDEGNISVNQGVSPKNTFRLINSVVARKVRLID